MARTRRWRRSCSIRPAGNNPAWTVAVVGGGACPALTTCEADPPRLPQSSPAATFAARSFPALIALSRSEEHTSELQSLMRISYAVFCLKQKTHNYIHTIY